MKKNDDELVKLDRNCDNYIYPSGCIIKSYIFVFESTKHNLN